jgi:hypothetical protein
MPFTSPQAFFPGDQGEIGEYPLSSRSRQKMSLNDSSQITELKFKSHEERRPFSEDLTIGSRAA